MRLRLTAALCTLLATCGVGFAQVPEHSICYDVQKPLPFEIEKTATWRMTPGQRFHLIADLQTAHTYEICRNGARFDPAVHIASDFGVNVSTDFPPSSCVLVHANRIGIAVDTPIDNDTIVGGTFRRLHERDTPSFGDVTHFQAQSQFHKGAERRFPLTALTWGAPGDVKREPKIFRLCLQDIDPNKPPNKNAIPGVTVWVDGAPMNRMPVDRDALILGDGGCIDFHGTDVIVQMNQIAGRSDEYLACGKLAFGPLPSP